jgi:hypothetical protein
MKREEIIRQLQRKPLRDEDAKVEIQADAEAKIEFEELPNIQGFRLLPPADFKIEGGEQIVRFDQPFKWDHSCQELVLIRRRNPAGEIYAGADLFVLYMLVTSELYTFRAEYRTRLIDVMTERMQRAADDAYDKLNSYMSNDLFHSKPGKIKLKEPSYNAAEKVDFPLSFENASEFMKAFGDASEKKSRLNESWLSFKKPRAPDIDDAIDVGKTRLVLDPPYASTIRHPNYVYGVDPGIDEGSHVVACDYEQAREILRNKR